MEKSIFEKPRNSEMKYNEIYFWTATINQWQHLLTKDKFKEIIISSLRYLCDQQKIKVYAFVIMPNHIHLIWKLLEPNGRESPKASFLKYTAHEFKKMIRDDASINLTKFYVDAFNKNYEFWQRDPLAIILYSKPVMLQKLEYIHNNPLASHWNLAKDPNDYFYSTAKYYIADNKNFDFLSDILDEF